MCELNLLSFNHRQDIRALIFPIISFLNKHSNDKKDESR
jgi:hypothetical protein